MSAQLATATFSIDKRWHARAERWARPDVVFDPAGFAVDVITERQARELVGRHHYAPSFPAARLSVGLIQKSGRHARPELVGAAVFSVPMSCDVIPARAGVPAREGVELGRFICTPAVAYNGESWFLRRALAILRAEKPEVRAVLSYADPLERETVEGELCKPAHFGTIYKASNAAFVGRAKPNWILLTRAGQVVSARSLSKIRNEDVGQGYAAQQLVDAGADRRRPFEAPTDWLRRVLVEPLFRRIRHPGNLAYVFGLDRATTRFAQARALPYPRAAT